MKTAMLAVALLLGGVGCTACATKEPKPITVYLEFQVQPRISAEVEQPILVKQVQVQKQDQTQSQSTNVEVKIEGGDPWYRQNWIWWTVGGVLLLSSGALAWVLTRPKPKKKK